LFVFCFPFFLFFPFVFSPRFSPPPLNPPNPLPSPPPPPPCIYVFITCFDSVLMLTSDRSNLRRTFCIPGTVLNAALHSHPVDGIMAASKRCSTTRRHSPGDHRHAVWGFAGHVMCAVCPVLLLADRLFTQSAILQLSGLSVWCPVGFVQGNYLAC